MTRLGASWRAVFIVVCFLTSTAGFAAPSAAAVAPDAHAATVARYGNVLRSFNPRMSVAWSRDLSGRLLLLSSYYGIDARLLVAIVGIESSWRSDAISPAGAQGFGQLMPGTASGLAVHALESLENLDGAARYLRRLLKRYATLGTERQYALAAASYNAGPAAVARYHGIPPYTETRSYVTHVMALWHRLRESLPGTKLAAPAKAIAAPKRVQPVLATKTETILPAPVKQLAVPAAAPVKREIAATPQPVAAPPAVAAAPSAPTATAARAASTAPPGGLIVVGEGPNGPILSDSPAARGQLIVIGEGPNGPILSDSPAKRKWRASGFSLPRDLVRRRLGR